MGGVTGNGAIDPCAATDQIDRDTQQRGRAGLRTVEREVDAVSRIAGSDGAFESGDEFIAGQAADGGRVGAGEIVIVVQRSGGTGRIVRDEIFLRKRSDRAVIGAQLPDTFKRSGMNRGGEQRGGQDETQGREAHGNSAEFCGAQSHRAPPHCNRGTGTTFTVGNIPENRPKSQKKVILKRPDQSTAPQRARRGRGVTA